MTKWKNEWNSNGRKSQDETWKPFFSICQSLNTMIDWSGGKKQYFLCVDTFNNNVLDTSECNNNVLDTSEFAYRFPILIYWNVLYPDIYRI